jgi:hypothetical protein
MLESKLESARVEMSVMRPPCLKLSKSLVRKNVLLRDEPDEEEDEDERKDDNEDDETQDGYSE